MKKFISSKFPSFWLQMLRYVEQVGRWSLSTFTGGLIFGAIFGLLVNIATVKVQEDISKQRALEALERESTYRILDVSWILGEEKRIFSLDNSELINSDSIMNRNFRTSVWDSTEVSKYLFQLDPEAASRVDVYYEIVVKGTNRMLEENRKLYNDLYSGCRPYYGFLTNEQPQSREYCNEIAKNFAYAQALIVGSILDSNGELKNYFHPTRDRLNSWWLRLLLGNKSVEILR